MLSSRLTVASDDGLVHVDGEGGGTTETVTGEHHNVSFARR